MTGNDIVSAVRILLQDSGAGRWLDSEFTLWLTDGQAEVCLLKPSAYTLEAQHMVVADSRQKVLQKDAHMLLDVPRNDSLRSITVTPREILDSLDPDWHAATGDDVENYVFDPRQPLVFHIYPRVTSGRKVDIVYAAVPPAVAQITQTLALNDIYRPALINYCMFRALSKDDEVGNAAKAAAYYQAFTQLVTAKAATEQGDSPNLQFIPFTPNVPGAAR